MRLRNDLRSFFWDNQKDREREGGVGEGRGGGGREYGNTFVLIALKYLGSIVPSKGNSALDSLCLPA